MSRKLFSGSAFVVIGVIVEIAIISYMAKKIFDPMAAEKMEKMSRDVSKYKLKPQDRYCPNCGEVISRAVTACVCRAKIDKNMNFCRVCGKSVEDIQKALVPAQPKMMRECICGAKVPEGKFI